MSSLRPAVLVLLSLMGGAWAVAAEPSPAPAAPPASGGQVMLARPAPTRDAAKAMFDGWKAPVPPRHLVGNIYYVGAIGVSSFLITTPQGHILIDTGFEDTVPIILRSVEQLGFRLSDIKILLSSHAHIDHTGGQALMQRLTGARVCASAEDARVLQSGGADDFIAFPKDMTLYTPVHVDQIMADGEKITLGSVTLTAHLTPGHTRGATTWTMDATEDGHTYHVVFFSSATVNAGTTLLSGAPYPGIVADFEKTFALLKKLPCDIFFAPHGGQFAMADKFAKLDQGAKPNPFIDPAGWATQVAGMERSFRSQLAREQAAAAK